MDRVHLSPKIGGIRFATSLETRLVWGTIVFMRGRQISWLAFALFWVVVLSLPAVASAAAQTRTPPGWTFSAGAHPDAQRRANEWSATMGLRNTQVLSDPDQDHFAETAALFERSEPIPAEAFLTEVTATQYLSGIVGEVVGGGEPEASGMRTAGDLEVAWARWKTEEAIYDCVLVPSFDTATLLIFAVHPHDLSETRGSLDLLLANMEGVSEPMPAFHLGRWRVGAILAWVALAFLLHSLMLPFVDRDRDHEQAGTRASGLLLVLVIIGVLVSMFMLRPRELAITHAGSSLEGMLTWVGVTGIAAAGMHFLIAKRFAQGQVQSAPMSGTYASGIMSRSGMYGIEDVVAASGSWVQADLGDGAAPADESGVLEAVGSESPPDPGRSPNSDGV